MVGQWGPVIGQEAIIMRKWGIVKELGNLMGQSIIVIGERHCDGTLGHFEGAMKYSWTWLYDTRSL